MTHRGKALAAGFAGLAIAAAVGAWLQASSPGGAHVVPRPGDLEPLPNAPAAEAPRPAAIALPPPASKAPPVPPQDPRAAPAPSASPPPPSRADSAPPQVRSRDPGDRLNAEALAHPDDPNKWVDVGRYLFDHAQPDAGKAAFRRAWNVAATPEARGTVLDAWRLHGLPRQDLDPAAPPTRKGGFDSRRTP